MMCGHGRWVSECEPCGLQAMHEADEREYEADQENRALLASRVENADGWDPEDVA